MSSKGVSLRLRARLEVLLWRHGWIWLVVIGIGTAAGVLYATVLLSTKAALNAARSVLEDEQRMAHVSPSKQVPAPRSENSLASLQVVLRQSPEVGELLRQMAEIARAEQILLTQADYRYSLNVTTRVIQVEVTQPIKAAYPQMRNYVESVLLAIPNASLDQIAARRDNVGLTQLEGRIKWSLWFVGASAGVATTNPAANRSPSQREPI